MNNIYLYDGSFNSLLILVCNLLYKNIVPKDIKSEEDYINNLIDTPAYLRLENEKELYDALKKKLTMNIFNTLYYVYLSSDEKRELVIYYFVKNALKYNNMIFGRRNLNCVNKALRLSKNVSREAHKLKGFLRFKLMKNNFYYGEFNSTNNVISLLAMHFKSRFMNEYFLIKDVKRQIYAFYDKENIIFLNKEDIIKLELDKDVSEDKVEELWKMFFKTIAIKERENKKVQMNFMPKKYWNYIIEMEEENESSDKK